MQPRMTIPPGVASLMTKAHRNEKLYATLNGDLGQMATQMRRLKHSGIEMGVSGGIPGFYTENDYLRGLRMIWEEKFEGWWNYRHQFIALELCTEDEFRGAFKR